MLKFLVVLTILIMRSDCKIAKNVPTGPRIAIIGAGVGGTGTAFHLNTIFPDAIVDIYEEGVVGGRMAVVPCDGEKCEAGATIIHPRNHYMVNFTKFFGLEHSESTSKNMGIFDGNEIVFKTSDSWVLSLAQLIWRYGYDVIKIRTWVSTLLEQFERIYNHQENGLAFSNVEKMLQSMSPRFVEMTKHSTRKCFTDEGFGSRFIDEIVHGGLKSNYGQTPDIHSFVGGVSMAGIEPGLFSVKGGNKQIPEQLLMKSNANLIKARVYSIRLLEDHKYLLFFHKKTGQKTTPDSAVYDIVIIAAPIHQHNNMEFHDFPEPIRVGSKFHRTVSNFIQGKLNPIFDGLSNVITSSGYEKTKYKVFNSIGEKFPVDTTDANEVNYTYKVFADDILSKSDLASIFESYQNHVYVDWWAYPDYSSTADLASFVLYKNLYYVNAIESAASAMEMSLIGAKNVALLAFYDWTGDFSNMNPIHVLHDDVMKSEL